MRVTPWGENTKGACSSCPHASEKHLCLVTGLYHPKAAVTFLLDYPTDGEINFTPWGETLPTPIPGKGREISSLVQLQRQALDRINRAVGRPGHLTKCIDPQEYNVGYLTGHLTKGNPSAGALQACRGYITTRLNLMRQAHDRAFGDLGLTHVLVPLGAAATAAVLGSKGKFKAQRGNVFTADFAGHVWQVVPTLSLRQLMAQSGVAQIVQQDIETAYKLAYGNQRQVTYSGSDILKMYSFPKSDEELLALTDDILAYHDFTEKSLASGKTADDWSLAVDTETNSLNMYESTARVLMVSVAWDTQKATTICLDHPEMPYSPEVARRCIERLMASPKPKVFHNYKYDYQALVLREGIHVNNVIFDTMLGAHYLYEDMKGFFGLDPLTSFMVPEYSGYKALIQEGLKQRVRERLLEGVGHDTPDYDQSYNLAPFFPDVDYQPAIEGTVNRLMLPEKYRRQLWTTELKYLQAFVAGDKKTLGKVRAKVGRICKKHSIELPSTATQRDYNKELEDKGYENVPFAVLLAYAAADADVTRQIFKEERRRAYNEVVTTRRLEPQGALDEMMQLLRDITIPASEALASAQYHGTQIDVERLTQYEQEIGDFRDKHEAALQQMTHTPDFNAQSPDQVEHVFRNVFPVREEDIVLTDTGKMSVRKDWLEEMESKYSKLEGYDTLVRFIFHLRRYRAAHKATHTFLSGLRELMDDRGRIHTVFNLNGTATGRLSSSRPNLQNIPHYMCRFPETSGWNIKQLFIPDEGQVFWQLDIAAAEIRVLCAYAEDPELIKALKDGLDIHSYTCAGVFDMEYAFVMEHKDTDPDVKLKRTAVKRVVFGTLYGAGDEKIAEQIFGSLSVDPVLREEQIAFARSTRLGIFARFPRVGQYIDGTRSEVEMNQVVKTFFGRRRRFDIANADRRLMGTAKRQAVNFKIQSTASDILISQLVELFGHLDEIGATFQLTVHDSLCGSIPYERLHELKPFFDRYIVDRVREKFSWLPVPFAYDLEVGPDYGRAVSIDALTKDPEDLTKKEAYVLDILRNRHAPAA